jgi:TIR domain
METVDFFISYTNSDRKWAEWIAWELEKEDYECRIQAWDFAPGSDFVRKMREIVEATKQVLVVLSPAYLASEFATAELDAAFARDPSGTKGVVVPVRIEDFEPGGLLKSRVYIDLVGKGETEARTALIQGISASRLIRAKPAYVAFPAPPRFPVNEEHVVEPPAEPPPTLRPTALLVQGHAIKATYELEGIAEVLIASGADVRVLVDPSVEELALEIARGSPEVLHFSGHMNGEHVLLQDTAGNPTAMGYQAFLGLLRSAPKPARLLYLNSSFSLPLVEQLQSDFIDAAIGVSGNITDRVATTVSVEFYRQLALGMTIGAAFAAALLAAKLSLEDDLSVLPKLWLRNEVLSSSLTFHPDQ